MGQWVLSCRFKRLMNDKGFFHFQVNSIQLLLSSSNSRYFEHPPIYCCFNLDTNSGRVKNTHRSLRFIQGHSPKVCFHSRPSVCIFPNFFCCFTLDIAGRVKYTHKFTVDNVNSGHLRDLFSNKKRGKMILFLSFKFIDSSSTCSQF